MAHKKPGTLVGKLARTFRNAVLGGIVAMGTVPVMVELFAYYDDITRDGGAALTEGEKKLVHSIFGDQIETSKIRKHERKGHPRYAATVEGGSDRHINFLGAHNYSDDYSKAWVGKKSLFMHEITHLWQHQNHWIVYNYYKRGCDVYSYKLDENSKFDDFCVEQQASIIGDYTALLSYPILKMNITEEDWENLKRVVENKFPQARITRTELESAQDSQLKSEGYHLSVPSI